jgi:membrane protein DedA with SNARE-associated domain
MNETTQFLVSHGPPLVFAAVFLDQIGLPLPVIPWSLAAGALFTAGKFSPFWRLGLTVLACLIADTLWFYLGRYRGHRVLGLLCRISLEPDSCVRRTQNLYTRYGLQGVVLAKFVPGLSTVVPPLAGMSGVKSGRFLLADGAGSLLYGGCFIFLGYLFCNQIQVIAAALVEIHVDQLYGDFQRPDHAAAVLAMRFAFFDSANGVPGSALLQKGYSRDIPLKAPTAAALIEGWNEALAQTLDSARLDFGRAGASPPKPGG